MYFSDPFTRMQAWIDLLLVANYRDSVIYVRGNKVDVKRGQIAKSQDFFATRWKWSRGKVIRFLDELQKCGQIVQQKSNVITLISVVNYEYYQQDGTTDEPQTDSRQYNKRTTDGTTDEPQIVQPNERRIKKNKEDNKETSLTRGKEIAAAAAAPSSAATAEASRRRTAKSCDTTDTAKVPYAEITALWNGICTGYPRLVKLSDSRKNKIRNRVAEMGGAEKAMPLLREIFSAMQDSHFLKGDNRRGWKASFDWLFENDKNWVKVYEGNYNNRPDTATDKTEAESTRRTQADADRQAAEERERAEERREKDRFTPPPGHTSLSWYREIKRRAEAGDPEAARMLAGKATETTN